VPRGLAFGLIGLAVGCRPPAAEPTPPRAGSGEAAVDQAELAGPSLAEIADAIDPGPRPAVSAAWPRWVGEALGVSPTAGEPAAEQQEASRALRAFSSQESLEGDAALAGVMGLLRALMLAERAAGEPREASVDGLLLLERLYALVDAPSLARMGDVVAPILAAVGGQLMAQGLVEEPGELSRLVDGTIRSAGLRHRRVVALLLRRAPEHADVPAVLGRLGPKLLGEDEALAVAVMQRSLSMQGSTASAEQWLDLASVCHRALELSCGRRAQQRAEAVASQADPDLRARLQRAHELAKSAERAVDLRDAPGLDDGLDQGEAFIELQRWDDARAVFEGLARLHPDDARPVVGLCRVVLGEHFDFMAAADIIERARPRDHLDEAWYELAIGVRATVLLTDVIPRLADRSIVEIVTALRPELMRMREDIAGLEALGSERGTVLRFAYELGMEAVPALGAEDDRRLHALERGLLTRARALWERAPHSADAYTLLLAAAEFSAERDEALAVLDVEPPADEPALHLRRAQAALDLVAQWDAADHVPQLLRLVEALPPEAGSGLEPRLAIDAHVVARRLGAQGGDPWPRIEQRYRARLDAPGGDADAQLLVALAVVVAEQGRADEALAQWDRALLVADDDDGREVASLHVLAVRLASGSAPAAREAEMRAALRALAESGSIPDVRLQARAWLQAIAPPSSRKKAAAELREAAALEASRAHRPRLLPGRSGVILRGQVQLGLGYSATEGLQLNVDVRGEPWLVKPCPVPVPVPVPR